MLLCLYLSDSEDFSVAWWEVGGGGAVVVKQGTSYFFNGF